MGPLDALWHLLNFLAPAVGMGVMLPSLAKLVWRQQLRAVPWRHLVRWTTLASALAWTAALIMFGRDGRMLSYGALVGAAALSLWWAGFVARAR